MNTTNHQTDTKINNETETDSDFDPILGGRAYTGKIGRLPMLVRNQLNFRLDNGEAGEAILAWLNANPEVREVLQQSFGGSAITAQNLSNWRRGGFRDYVRQRERMQFVESWLYDADELAIESEGDLAGRLSGVLVAELAMAVQEALPRLTDPVERCERITKYLTILTRVQQEERAARRLEIEEAEREAAEQEARKQKAEAISTKKMMMAIQTGKKFEPPTRAEIEAEGFEFSEEQWAEYEAKVDDDNAVSGTTTGGGRKKRGSNKASKGKSENGTDGTNKTDGGGESLGRQEQGAKDLVGRDSSIKANQGSAEGTGTETVLEPAAGDGCATHEIQINQG